MLRELRCENYKTFEDETRFPLSSLTVLVGPNNAGKSTALDLVRLTKNGHSLDLTSGRGRLRRFENLLGNRETESLTLGRRISADVALSPGKSGGPTFHLADDLSFESVFVPFGNGSVLKRRDVFLHPAGDQGSTKQRILSKSVEVSPAEEVGAEPAKPGPSTLDLLNLEESEESNNDSALSELWFGLPWGEQSGVRKKDSDKTTSGPERMYRPTGPYRRSISKSYTVDASLIGLIFDMIRTTRQHNTEKSPLDLSAGPFELSMTESADVNSEEEPPPLRILPTHDVLEHWVGSNSRPAWFPSNKEDMWDAVRMAVLSPLVEKINNSFDRMDSTHLPSFRARPERYYGPQDPLTPLLEKYQDAHPTPRTSMRHQSAGTEGAGTWQTSGPGRRSFSR
jgi:hypothetical protein